MFKGKDTVYYVSNLNGDNLSDYYLDRKLAVKALRIIKKRDVTALIRYRVVTLKRG